MASEINDMVRLAGRAATLSTELYSVQEACQHESTAGEISAIADELARLSTTLWHLNDAIKSDPAQYTDAFDEDLAEITMELTCVFEEISECCAGLRLADSNASVVSWFFKKGRVAKLLKHLEALKGTLLVMRTVLWHGRDYGTHTSDRIAESNPHTMREDRVILESVLAQNRNAILDLHELTTTINRAESKKMERTPSKAGDHHRELTESTGVDIPPIPDVLPLSSSEKEDSVTDTTPSKLERTFSKRGVRLGVYASILDLSAHEAPNGLKKKWIQQAHLRQRPECTQPRQHGGDLPSLPELSRISEVDTACGSLTNLRTDTSPQTLAPAISESPDVESPKITPEVPFNTPIANASQEGQNASVASKEHGSTVGKKLRRVFSRMSMINLHSPTRGGIRGHGSSSEASTKSASKGKEREDNTDAKRDVVSKEPPCSRETPLRLDLDHVSKPGRRTLLEVIKHKFERSPLNTPDMEEEFEYGKV